MEIKGRKQTLFWDSRSGLNWSRRRTALGFSVMAAVRRGVIRDCCRVRKRDPIDTEHRGTPTMNHMMIRIT